MKISLTFLFVVAMTANVALAQEEEVTINIPQTIAELSTECPGEMARISPCTGGEGVDLEACSTCVALGIVESNNSDNASSDTAVARQDNNNNENNNDSCENLQDGVCQSIDNCADSCSVLQQESFFTFGSECEEIFLDLVGCVLSNTDVAVNDCPIVGCTDDGTAVEDDNSGGNALNNGAIGMMFAGFAGAAAVMMA